MATKSASPSDLEKTFKSTSAPFFDADLQAETVEKPSGVHGLKWWVERLAVETGGIQRVTDEDRAENTTKWWNACTFW